MSTCVGGSQAVISSRSHLPGASASRSAPMPGSGLFLAALPSPMLLGKIEFDDGTWRTGFSCDVSAATGADISQYGSWPAAIAAGAVEQ
jgi:cyanate permease